MPGFDTKFEWAYEQASNFGGVARFELRNIIGNCLVRVEAVFNQYGVEVRANPTHPKGLRALGVAPAPVTPETFWRACNVAVARTRLWDRETLTGMAFENLDGIELPLTPALLNCRIGAENYTVKE